MASEASSLPSIPQGRRRTTDTLNSSSRCTQCNARPGENPKNLVVCIDGTGNNPITSKNTNVVKLLDMVDQDESTTPRQHAKYWSGIGADHESQKAVFCGMDDMAFAWNLGKNIKESYRWLAESYTAGDKIYLFGFSRGAYQVRILAAMIHEVGLIIMSNMDRVEEAYECYKSSRSGGQKARQTARRFKKRFCLPDVRVYFVGVWDTVSSVSGSAQDISLSRSLSAEHACHFRHALALDELRVMFMPEYFHEINSLEDFKYTNTSPSERKATSSTSELTRVLPNGNAPDLSADNKSDSDIKEVWFAGSHSDVGGKNKIGKDHQPGNVSLLWMRREAAASGLVLKPTEIVWLPHDLDHGITDSMTNAWRTLEYVPTKHQVSYSGLGKKALRFHQQQPRRIIPGQKIHASVLYAHAYKPKATLGAGINIPITQLGLEDTELHNEIWETGLFDASTAEALIDSLGMPQGVAPINLDKLLFMLRFREGIQSVRNIPDWQDKFTELMNNGECATVVRLVAIVAYHETSCDPEARPNSCESISEGILLEAKSCLKDVMDYYSHRDFSRVVALLRLLTKHQILREHILAKDILETLVESFLEVIKAPERLFVLAMDGLNCLLQCVDIRLTIVEKLRSNPPGDAISRLSLLLEVKDPLHLTAALRTVSILVRFPEGRDACSVIEPKIKKLASKNDQLIGPLAAQLYLALYNPYDESQLDIRNAHVRTNLASALLCLARQPDLEQKTFLNIFGLGATELTARHIKLIGELKAAALKEKNTQERTAATIILLKLRESKIICEHYRETELLDIFVSQLRHKDSALLAALALATCLDCPDLKYIKKKLPEHIITMLRGDYFDDAVSEFQGFEVFGEFMRHADLRKEIMSCDVIKLLTDKLEIGNKKATRCGLMYLDTFRSCDPDGQWTSKLFQKSSEYLKAPAWKNQEAGANILSALAQTEYGVEAISARVPEIVEMLLPEGYLLIRPEPTLPQTPGNPKSSDKPDAQKKDTSSTPKSPSWMKGPAFALRILAQNATLRDCIRKTIQYGYVKELHQNGALVKNDTAARPLKTSNRAQVEHELDEMIHAVDSD